MKTSITASAEYTAENVNLSGSTFRSVNLTGTTFEDVNLGKATFHSINLSDAVFTATQLGGATFRHIGPPPNEEGKQARQRPALFDQAMLCDSHFVACDLSGVRIENCNMDGMTIDGISVGDLIAAYRKVKDSR